MKIGATGEWQWKNGKQLSLRGITHGDVCYQTGWPWSSCLVCSLVLWSSHRHLRQASIEMSPCSHYQPQIIWSDQINSDCIQVWFIKSKQQKLLEIRYLQTRCRGCMKCDRVWFLQMRFESRSVHWPGPPVSFGADPSAFSWSSIVHKVRSYMELRTEVDWQSSSFFHFLLHVPTAVVFSPSCSPFVT